MDQSKSAMSINLVTLTWLCCMSLTLAMTELDIDEDRTLECHVRDYSYMVTKKPYEVDGRILTCSGQVTVKSCWGRCDSSEIADYQIPYKLSDHPVCTYEETQSRIVRLECDAGYPDPEHQVIDAISCRCSACTSQDTSCQTLNS